MFPLPLTLISVLTLHVFDLTEFLTFPERYHILLLHDFILSNLIKKNWPTLITLILVFPGTERVSGPPCL